MSKNEVVVDSISGKTREQLHRESEEYYRQKREADQRRSETPAKSD